MSMRMGRRHQGSEEHAYIDAAVVSNKQSTTLEEEHAQLNLRVNQLFGVKCWRKSRPPRCSALSVRVGLLYLALSNFGPFLSGFLFQKDGIETYRYIIDLINGQPRVSPASSVALHSLILVSSQLRSLFSSSSSVVGRRGGVCRGVSRICSAFFVKYHICHFLDTMPHWYGK